MKNLNFEYFKKHFDPAFMEEYVHGILNNGKVEPEESEIEYYSLDFIYEKLGIDLSFEYSDDKNELSSIFFHLNNPGDGYVSFANPPFGITKDLKRDDVHKMFGTPDKVNKGIKAIGLNPSDIFKFEGYDYGFEYTKDLKIKTFSVQTKFSKED